MRIEVEDLVLRCGRATALDRLTFSLDGGKIYGLLGRDGAGKSSLLSVLAAFRRQSGGTVLVDGQPVFENAAVTGRICLIRDAGEMISIGSVEDALDFAKWLRPNWDAGLARSLLNTFGLTPKMQVSGMSKGQQSALGVVVGLATRAPLTMFDETQLGMDAPARNAFYEALLADYIDYPRTIILSSHLIEQVGPLLEEVVIIDAGRLVLHANSQALLSWGTAVTGPADTVDSFVSGLTVLDARQLGPTKSVMIYGVLDDARRAQAAVAGLELGPVAMQDLFVHLTRGSR